MGLGAGDYSHLLAVAPDEAINKLITQWTIPLLDGADGQRAAKCGEGSKIRMAVRHARMHNGLITTNTEQTTGQAVIQLAEQVRELAGQATQSS